MVQDELIGQLLVHPIEFGELLDGTFVEDELRDVVLIELVDGCVTS